LFESDEFIEEVSRLCGHKLIRDETRNFWGCHTYTKGDKLDIHVDAGLHPTNKLKKQVTLGLYLSSNWKDEYGCQLEIWKGENAGLNNPTLYEKVDSIAPKFNRAVLFTCNDYAWHGNPEPANCPEESKRIFVTISYLSSNDEDANKRVKALFIKRPENLEKDRLRLLRANHEKYKEVYRV
jgi:Rps23 Pro-64 3,4-dihydroxylase Tpa1-like proline 4-hydroxylase